MHSIDPADGLGELDASQRWLARDLEALGLEPADVALTFTEVCASRDIDPTPTSASLTESIVGGGATDWAVMDATELIGHLESTHHRYLWDELPRLTALVDHVVAVHGDRHPELHAIAACFAAVRADLEPHLMNEERVLFPKIRELEASLGPSAFRCGTVRNPMSTTVREHESIGGLLAGLRRLTGGYESPPDGCATYKACFAGLAELEADTYLHMYKENDVLFPFVVWLEAERDRPRL